MIYFWPCSKGQVCVMGFVDLLQKEGSAVYMLFHLPRFDHGHDSFFCLFFKEKMGLTDRLGTISRRHVGGWDQLTCWSDIRFHADDGHLRSDRMMRTVHASTGRLLALALLPPAMHPNAEADNGHCDERRRNDYSGQFNCNWSPYF